MFKFVFGAAMALAIAVGSAGAGNAQSYHFVGSWQVDSGPSWADVPAAMSGQQAAAFLFGGLASDYAISTVDNNPANINDLSWISAFGSDGGQQVAQDHVVSTNGLYRISNDTSAYVNDNAVGDMFTNFAFAMDVPEPASMVLLGGALVGLGAARRRTATRA